MAKRTYQKLQPIVCGHCSLEFKPRNRYSRYCGQECQWAAKRKKALDLPPATKRCSHCKVWKASSAFHASLNTVTRLQSWCKDCMHCRARPKEMTSYTCEGCGQLFRRIARSAYAEVRRRKSCRRCTWVATVAANGGQPPGYTGSRHFAGRLISSWQHSASRRGYVWQLSKEHLDEKYDQQAGICALSGLRFGGDFGEGRRVSIDRIEADKGYIVGNFQFVCVSINMMRNKLSESDFLSWCSAVVAYRGLVSLPAD